MLEYDYETQTLYLTLSHKPIMDSDEVIPGVVVDFDKEDAVVGIEWLKGSIDLNYSIPDDLKTDLQQPSKDLSLKT